METLVDIDKSLFVFLNSLGSNGFDFIWLSITDKKSSIPLYLFLIYYIYKKFSNKEFLKYLILVIILIVLTDQTSGFFKDFLVFLMIPDPNPTLGITWPLHPVGSILFGPHN